MIFTSPWATVGAIFENKILVATAPYAYKLLKRERNQDEVIKIMQSKGFTHERITRNKTTLPDLYQKDQKWFT